MKLTPSLSGIAILFGTVGVSLASESSVKPAMRILRDECMNCHKPGKARGGLLLHTRDKMLEGGDNGPGVVPGDLDESLIYQLVLAEGDPHMPPKKQLSDGQQEYFKKWILAGAEWDPAVFDELPQALPVGLKELPPQYHPSLAIALSPDQTKIAVARGGRVHLCGIEDKTVKSLHQFDAHVETIQSLVWHPDGQRIITAGFQNIQVWNAADGSKQIEIRPPLLGAITCMALSKDGRLLFAADGEGGGSAFIHRIDIQTGKVVHSWKGHEDTIYSLKFSPDGSRLLSGSADKIAKLWNTENHELSASFEGHTSHLLSVAFDPEGKRIATTGADHEIKIWDVATGEQIVILGDKKSVYVGLDWIEKGSVLLATTENGGVSLFSEFVKHDGAQRSSGTKHRQLKPVPATLTTAQGTKDGKKVFASTFEGNLHFWDVSTGNPVTMNFAGEAPKL